MRSAEHGSTSFVHYWLGRAFKPCSAKRRCSRLAGTTFRENPTQLLPVISAAMEFRISLRSLIPSAFGSGTQMGHLGRGLLGNWIGNKHCGCRFRRRWEAGCHLRARLADNGHQVAHVEIHTRAAPQITPEMGAANHGLRQMTLRPPQPLQHPASAPALPSGPTYRPVRRASSPATQSPGGRGGIRYAPAAFYAQVGREFGPSKKSKKNAHSA